MAISRTDVILRNDCPYFIFFSEELVFVSWWCGGGLLDLLLGAGDWERDLLDLGEWDLTGTGDREWDLLVFGERERDFFR